MSVHLELIEIIQSLDREIGVDVTRLSSKRWVRIAGVRGFFESIPDDRVEGKDNLYFHCWKLSQRKSYDMRINIVTFRDYLQRIIANDNKTQEPMKYSKSRCVKHYNDIIYAFPVEYANAEYGCNAGGVDPGIAYDMDMPSRDDFIACFEHKYPGWPLPFAKYVEDTEDEINQIDDGYQRCYDTCCVNNPLLQAVWRLRKGK
jgi:hypothetical protein